MKFILKLIIVFAAFPLLAQDTIQVDFDFISNFKSYTYLKSSKVKRVEHLTPRMLKKSDALKLVVNNYYDKNNQLYWLINREDKQENIDLSAASELSNILTQNISNFQACSPFRNFNFFTRGGGSSDNPYENPEYIQEMDNEEIIKFLESDYTQFQNILFLRDELYKLDQMQVSFDYKKDKAKRVISELEIDEYVTDLPPTVKEQEFSFNIMFLHFFINQSLVNQYQVNLQNIDSELKDWQIKAEDFRNELIKNSYVQFFSDNSNIQKLYDALLNIYEFQLGLVKANYNQTLIVPLSEGINDISVLEPSFSKHEEPKELFNVDLNTTTKLVANASFGISFSGYFRQDKLEYFSDYIDTLNKGSGGSVYWFEESKEKDYFPAFGSYFNFVLGKSYSPVNLGFSTALIVPLKAGTSPTIGIGPSITIGKLTSTSKLHVNLIVGFSSKERIDPEIAKNKVVTGNTLNNINFKTYTTNGTLNIDEYTIRTYESVFSIGLSWEFGSRGNSNSYGSY